MSKNFGILSIIKKLTPKIRTFIAESITGYFTEELIFEVPNAI